MHKATIAPQRKIVHQRVLSIFSVMSFYPTSNNEKIVFIYNIGHLIYCIYKEIFAPV